MAYHLLPTALEELNRESAGEEAFASAIRHALRGHVPVGRLLAAGRTVQSKRLGREAAIRAAVARAYRRDLNPIAFCLLNASSVEGALAIHRGLNALPSLTTKTELAFENGAAVLKRRFGPPGVEDVVACRDVHLAAMNIVLSRASPTPGAVARSSADSPMPRARIGPLAEDLGLRHTAVGETATVLENSPTLAVAGLARELGCQARTLQRALRAAGTTANLIRQAAMLGGALALMRSAMTLTDIAHEFGYADQSHMTRAFVSSCGLPPSLLRKAFD